MRESVLGRDADGHFALWKGMVAGSSAGIIGQFIASPTDLCAPPTFATPPPRPPTAFGLCGGSVKVQMQADGKRVLAGHAPRYKCVPPPHPHPTGRAVPCRA